MSALDEAKRLLEKIADANKTKLGSTEFTYVSLALEILLKDYIQRASWALADVEKLTPSQDKPT
jgi:hypothetical protein